MKITLLAFILFTTLSFGQVIKFPYSFKMNHVYQECSACHNVAYHRWKLMDGQNFPSPILKDAAQVNTGLKNYSERMKNTFSGTLSNQNQAETECQMTKTGKHAWLEKSKLETSQITQDEFNEMKKKKDEENQATIIQEKKAVEQNQKIETIRLKSLEVHKLMEEAKSSTTTKEKIIKYENVVKENLALLKLDGTRIFQDFYIENLTSLSWYLIINKEFEKAYQLLANYIYNKKDFGTSGNYDNDTGVLINFSHAILFSNRKLDEFWEIQKIGCNYGNWHKAMSIDLKDLKENYNISDPRSEEINTKIEDLYVLKFKRTIYALKESLPFLINLGVEFNINLNNRLLNNEILKEITNSTRGFKSIKIEDNLYSIIAKKCMFFYCYDEDGNVQILNGCKDNIKEKKLALKIEESKKIKLDNLKTKKPKEEY